MAGIGTAITRRRACYRAPELCRKRAMFRIPTMATTAHIAAALRPIESMSITLPPKIAM